VGLPVKRKKDLVAVSLTFVALYLYWVVLSGILDVVHLSLGILSALLVAYFFSDLLMQRTGRGYVSATITRVFRFVPYLFWLLCQIVRANIDVVKIILDPKLPISPCIIKFDPGLSGDVPLTLLANSITLTPGTLTLDIGSERSYYVHCLTQHHGEELLAGEMHLRVGAVFGGDDA